MAIRKRDPASVALPKPPRTRTISSDPNSVLNQLLGFRPQNVSQRVENISRRLYQLSMLNVPRMTATEWAVIVMALKAGVALDEMNVGAHVLAWAHAYGEVAHELFGIEAMEVARRLIDAGAAVNIAVAEMTERYWQFGEGDGSTPHAERLELLQLIDRESVREWVAGAARRKSLIEAGMSASIPVLE